MQLSLWNSGLSPKCFIWRWMPHAKCHICNSLSTKQLMQKYQKDPLPMLSFLMNCDKALISAQLAQSLSLWQRNLHQGKRQGYSEIVACPGLSLIYEMRPRSLDWTDWLARDSCSGRAAARYGEWEEKNEQWDKNSFPSPHLSTWNICFSYSGSQWQSELLIRRNRCLYAAQW